MTPGLRFRFGVFEADAASGELRRQGLRIRLNVQPFQVLLLLLARPGEVLTREEIAAALWPTGTFVDHEHGVNSAVNRIRDALGDRARNPRFLETLPRRGYRFVAPVERLPPAEPLQHLPTVEISPAERPVENAGQPATPAVLTEAPAAQVPERMPDPPRRSLLARPHQLPQASAVTVRTLFLLLQVMYLLFYVAALANLREVDELFAALPHPTVAFAALVMSAVLLLPVRLFLLTAVLFRPPDFAATFLRLWPFLLPLDLLWSLAPFLLLNHLNAGLALACVAPLVYAPFAQRSLVLMGAAAKPSVTARRSHGVH